MTIFERFEDKKFEIHTLEDYDRIDTFSIEELEDEKKYLETQIESEADEKELKELQQLHSVISMVLINKKTPPKEELDRMRDEMFLPEYRKDGYFNSEEFKVIEQEVDDYIRTLEGVNTNNFEILKQEILRNKYHINWLPYHKRFMPDVRVIID